MVSMSEKNAKNIHLSSMSDKRNCETASRNSHHNGEQFYKKDGEFFLKHSETLYI